MQNEKFYFDKQSPETIKDFAKKQRAAYKACLTAGAITAGIAALSAALILMQLTGRISPAFFVLFAGVLIFALICAIVNLTKYFKTREKTEEELALDYIVKLMKDEPQLKAAVFNERIASLGFVEPDEVEITLFTTLGAKNTKHRFLIDYPTERLLYIEKKDSMVGPVPFASLGGYEIIVNDEPIVTKTRSTHSRSSSYTRMVLNGKETLAGVMRGLEARSIVLKINFTDPEFEAISLKYSSVTPTNVELWSIEKSINSITERIENILRGHYVTSVSAPTEPAIVSQTTPELIEEDGGKAESHATKAEDEIRNNVLDLTPEKTPLDELKALKEMLDLGLISEEDYEAKKKQILGI